MKELLVVKGIFDAISSTTLSTIKSKIIKEHSDNELFKRCLEFLLNDTKVTGISKKKITKKLNLNLEKQDFKDILGLFEYILSHNTGSDKDIIEVQNFITQQPLELREFITGLITKGLKIGANSKLVNKSIPNLIPTFSVMLAESYDKNKKRLTGNNEFILTTKLDGNRIILIKDSNKINMFTRQGKPYDQLVEIIQDAEMLPDGVYDGEILAIGEFKDSKEQFTETMKRCRLKGVKTGLKMVCYDYIENVKDFYNGIDNTPCIDRKNKLKGILTNLNLNYIKCLDPLYIGNDISKINEYLTDAVKNGEEGIMISISDSVYSCKRVKTLLKCKVFNTCDIRCIRVEKGEGKYSNVVGKLICDYKGFELGVGSGLSDELRQKFINHPEEVEGKIVEVQYFEELKTDGKLSVRFPTFIRIREDGKEVSYN